MSGVLDGRQIEVHYARRIQRATAYSSTVCDRPSHDALTYLFAYRVSSSRLTLFVNSKEDCIQGAMSRELTGNNDVGKEAKGRLVSRTLDTAFYER